MDVLQRNQHECAELTKDVIEKQFNDLFDKARQLYPDIEENISSYSSTMVHTDSLKDYLDLIMQTPLETSTNQVVVS